MLLVCSSLRSMFPLSIVVGLWYLQLTILVSALGLQVYVVMHWPCGFVGL